MKCIFPKKSDFYYPFMKNDMASILTNGNLYVEEQRKIIWKICFIDHRNGDHDYYPKIKMRFRDAMKKKDFF